LVSSGVISSKPVQVRKQDPDGAVGRQGAGPIAEVDRRRVCELAALEAGTEVGDPGLEVVVSYEVGHRGGARSTHRSADDLVAALAGGCLRLLMRPVLDGDGFPKRRRLTVSQTCPSICSREQASTS